MLLIGDGVVAQLVRASACHAEGRGFEPLQSRHLISPFGDFFLLNIFIIKSKNTGHCKKKLLGCSNQEKGLHHG